MDLPRGNGSHAGNLSIIHRCIDFCQNVRSGEIVQRRTCQQLVWCTCGRAARISRYVDRTTLAQLDRTGALSAVVLVSFALPALRRAVDCSSGCARIPLLVRRVDARSRRCREASSFERPGWSLTHHTSLLLSLFDGLNYEAFFEIPFAWRCCRFHDVARSWPTGPEQMARQIDHPGCAASVASDLFLLSLPPLLSRQGLRRQSRRIFVGGGKARLSVIHLSYQFATYG